MTTDTLRGLSDAELKQLDAAVDVEIKDRTEKRKQDAIAKIRAIAMSEHIAVSIGGVRGRPAKVKTDEKAVRNGR